MESFRFGSAPGAGSIPNSIEELEAWLSEPTETLLERWPTIEGDLLILGAGGKMGPTLAMMARRADQLTGMNRRIVAVSRFSDTTVRQRLTLAGVETVAADLLDENVWDQLPDAPNVLVMLGFKFGTASDPSRTWAMNCLLPAMICRRYKNSRITAFSSGNVYAPVPVTSQGATEDDEPHPVGEYAMSCLGRERIYQYFSRHHGVPVALLRLNYATELRYGVLVDIALWVQRGDPIDVRMGYVNVIWLADANAMALAALAFPTSPARIINVAGLEILSVRQVAQEFGRLLGKPVVFSGQELPTALLNDGRQGAKLLGQPRVSAEQMIEWTARWIAAGRPLLNKPTHFHVVDGKF
ncbi:MAG: epimerase [Pirellulaceae bacterium]|nr:MAG: epimerase [Pirellulaceae bacterium]GIW93378.1 MAG: epimerase [Pirellulaceae bacterium]